MIARRNFIRAAGLTALLGGTALRGEVIDLNDAINKAGRQRMLSQRLGKAYLAIVQNVEGPLAQQVLEKSMALFDRQLVELKTFAPAGEVRETYVALESAWSGYKGALIGTAPTRAGVAPMLADAARVLALAHKGTVQLEALSARPAGKLVNIAGRQRMLSQRAARAFFLVAAGHDTPAVRKQLEVARAEFVQGLATLQGAPISTPSIRNELDLAKSQWLFYDAALGKAANPDTLQAVATTSERIFEVMDNLTSMYDTAVRDLL